MAEFKIALAFIGWLAWACCWDLGKRLGERWHGVVSIVGTSALVLGMLNLLL